METNNGIEGFQFHPKVAVGKWHGDDKDASMYMITIRRCLSSLPWIRHGEDREFTPDDIGLTELEGHSET